MATSVEKWRIRVVRATLRRMKHAPNFLAAVDAARARITEYTVAEIAAQREAGTPMILVDVREDREWEAGRIAGAEHLGKGIIERDAEARFPDQDAHIVLYCGGGFRSALAADALRSMGFTRVSSMDGGIREWREAGLPMEVSDAD